MSLVLRGWGLGKGPGTLDACKCLLSSACCTPFSSEGGTGHREFAHQSERCLFRGQVSVSLQRTGSVGNDSRPDCSLSQKLSQRQALESLGGLPGSKAHLWGHSAAFTPGPRWLPSPRQPQVNLPPCSTQVEAEIFPAGI